MNIATIGYFTDFNHRNVHNIDFRSKETILDYDMLIINFAYLFEEYESLEKYGGKDLLTQVASQRIKEDIIRRKNEIDEFLASGRNIIVISPFDEIVYRYTGERRTSGTGRNASTTNIVEEVSLLNVLPYKIKTCSSSGKRIIGCNEKIEKILKKYKENLEYNSYLDEKDASCPLLKIENTTKVVADCKKYKNGMIMIFPNHKFNKCDEERTFLNDICDLLKLLNCGDKKELPEWIAQYNTDEENDEKQKLNVANDNLEKLVTKIEKFNKNIKEMDEEKRIFVESGDNLEEIVKNIFEKMRYKIIKFSGNEEDLVITDGANTFVFEIKGLDGSAAEKNVAQTVKWKTNYFIDTGVKAKGVLVVNTYKNKELKERKESFPNQMLKYAEHEEICLINSIQLYNLYKKYLCNEISIEEISKSILNTNGKYKEYDDWALYLNN